MGNGGWTDGYKITKANDYLLKKDIYSSEWEIGDFCPRNPRNSWRLCVWDERVFFAYIFHFFEIPRGREIFAWIDCQEHVSDCGHGVP